MSAGTAITGTCGAVAFALSGDPIVAAGVPLRRLP